MPNPESTIVAAVWTAAPRHVRLFRNNVGMAWREDGTPVRYGLCTGSADLIGWTVRDGVAVFTAVEVKTARGVVSPEQHRFLDAVRDAGGIAVVARGAGDITDL